MDPTDTPPTTMLRTPALILAHRPLPDGFPA